MKTLVSIVIPNNGRDISATKAAISRMSKNVELIEVDLGLERSWQRNIGICAAKGKYIFILDSDQVPSEALIQECYEFMEANSKCKGLFIPEIIVGNDWFTKLRNFERGFYVNTCIDVVRFVRAEFCPFFDETLSGPEDADWDMRILSHKTGHPEGFKATSINPLYHYDNITFWDYLKKKSYYTKSMGKFLNKHPEAKVLKFAYRCFGVFMENGKWMSLVKHPVMAIKLYSLIFVRAIIYLKDK